MTKAGLACSPLLAQISMFTHQCRVHKSGAMLPLIRALAFPNLPFRARVEEQTSAWAPNFRLVSPQIHSSLPPHNTCQTAVAPAGSL